MNSGYYPVVANPSFRRVQTESGGFQKPFFFGGSQVPINLNLSKKSYSGGGIQSSLKKGNLFKIHKMPHIK